MISNIAQAVLSLAPVPGLPIAYMVSIEIFKKGMALAEKAYELYKKAEDVELREKAKTAYEAFKNIKELHEKLAGGDETKGLLQSSDQGPVDMESMRLLAELLTRGLAQRYEDVITARLDTSQPNVSLLPLARVGARRCFEYLQSQPFFLPDADSKTSLLKQRARLLNSVSLGKLDKNWRERLSEKASSLLLPGFIRNLQKAALPTFPTGVKHGKGKFTSEGIYLRSAWYDEKAYYKAESKDYITKEAEVRTNPYPTYGYAYLESADSESRQPFKLAPVPKSWEKMPVKEKRYYQPVTKEHIAAYLKSESVREAKKKGKTVHELSSISFSRRI